MECFYIFIEYLTKYKDSKNYVTNIRTNAKFKHDFIEVFLHIIEISFYAGKTRTIQSNLKPFMYNRKILSTISTLVKLSK